MITYFYRIGLGQAEPGTYMDVRAVIFSLQDAVTFTAKSPPPPPACDQIGAHGAYARGGSHPSKMRVGSGRASGIPTFRIGRP